MNKLRLSHIMSQFWLMNVELERKITVTGKTTGTPGTVEFLFLWNRGDFEKTSKWL